MHSLRRQTAFISAAIIGGAATAAAPHTLAAQAGVPVPLRCASLPTTPDTLQYTVFATVMAPVGAHLDHNNRLQLDTLNTAFMAQILDESGTPSPSTFRLAPGGTLAEPRPGQEADHLAAFLTAIANSLSRAHYFPGAIAGCVVKAYVTQPYMFKIHH